MSSYIYIIAFALKKASLMGLIRFLTFFLLLNTIEYRQ